MSTVEIESLLQKIGDQLFNSGSKFQLGDAYRSSQKRKEAQALEEQLLNTYKNDIRELLKVIAQCATVLSGESMAKKDLTAALTLAHRALRDFGGA